MALLTNQLSLSPLDPTAQKLADLEARLAKLESVLSVGATGDATLRSGTGITIDSGTTLTLKSSMAMTAKSASTMDLQSSATMNLTGAVINLN